MFLERVQVIGFLSIQGIFLCNGIFFMLICKTVILIKLTISNLTSQHSGIQELKFGIAVRKASPFIMEATRWLPLTPSVPEIGGSGGRHRVASP